MWQGALTHGEKEDGRGSLQEEPDLLDKIVLGNIDSEERKEFPLDSIMADFIHMDAAININSAEADAMTTVKMEDSDDVLSTGHQPLG